MRDICISMSIVVLLTISKLWITSDCSQIDEGMRGVCVCVYFYTYRGVLLSQSYDICRKMDGLEITMLSEIEQIPKRHRIRGPEDQKAKGQ